MRPLGAVLRYWPSCHSTPLAQVAFYTFGTAVFLFGGGKARAVLLSPYIGAIERRRWLPPAGSLARLNPLKTDHDGESLMESRPPLFLAMNPPTLSSRPSVPKP
ncbi:hypothetical protein VDGL01_06462 [Verticillium dahliae]